MGVRFKILAWGLVTPFLFFSMDLAGASEGVTPPAFLKKVDQSSLYRETPWYKRILPGARVSRYEEVSVFERHPKLEGVHADLVKIIDIASREVDLIVFEGCRTLKKQKEYVKKGLSKTLNSRHLKCAAIDVVFKKKDGSVNWSWPQSIATIKYLRGIGSALGIKCLRDGSSWDKGMDVSGNKFRDGFHLESRHNCNP